MNTEVNLPYGETSLRQSIPDRFGWTLLEPRDMKKALDAIGRYPEISIIPGGPSTISLLE